MPYTPTVWVNGTSPYMNQTNLRKLRDELASQATARGVSHSLPVWTDGTAPYLTDAAPWQEMERVARLVAASLALAEYEETKWYPGWDPPRNATNLNRLEAQAQANRAGIDNLNPLYPASYYTGPLGANNILPSAGKPFLMLFPLSIGLNWQQYKAQAQARATAIGRSFDSVHVHFDGGGTFGGEANCAAFYTESLDEAEALGSFSSLTWTPNRTIADINAGGADTCIDAMADYLGGKPYQIMLRIFHEHNLGYPAGGFVWKGSGQPFIDAWHRVVERFDARGATNVGFWWCPFELAGDTGSAAPTTRTATNASYPGDAYVDWIGTDIYNFEVTGGGGSSTPLHAGHAEFWEIFNYPYNASYSADPAGNMHDKWGPVKPFIIGETGTIYDAAQPTKKGQWYRNVVDHANGVPGMEYLLGVNFSDSDTSGFDFNWMVDYPTSNADVFDGFVDMATSSLWNTP
jgi:hypothetical protein